MRYGHTDRQTDLGMNSIIERACVVSKQGYFTNISMNTLFKWIATDTKL